MSLDEGMTLSALEVRLCGPELDNHHTQPKATIALVVDSICLVSRLGAYERAFIASGFPPGLVGGYGRSPLSAVLVAALVGHTAQEAGAASPSTLADCACGIRGCWPIVASVVRRGGLVVWENFSHGRAPGSASGRRDYSRFGPFCFEEQSYFRQVERIQHWLLAHDSLEPEAVTSKLRDPRRDLRSPSRRRAATARR